MDGCAEHSGNSTADILELLHFYHHKPLLMLSENQSLPIHFYIPYFANWSFCSYFASYFFQAKLQQAVVNEASLRPESIEYGLFHSREASNRDYVATNLKW